MINVFRSLLALSRFFKFHDGWDNLEENSLLSRQNEAPRLYLSESIQPR